MIQRSGLPALVDLDGSQRSVVGHRSGLLTVLGGPGTGKTACLIHLTAGLASALGADAVLGLALTRTSARTWQARSSGLSGGLAPLVTTFHSVAGQIVSAYEPSVTALRLMTAPEQESRIREMLRGVGESSVRWPTQWSEAIQTRTFARQLRRAVARIRGLGLDPMEVRGWAVERDDLGWAAIADFTAEYLDVLDWEGALDYQELLIRACRELDSDRAVPSQLRWRAVLVDEGQELDALQFGMLQLLVDRAEVAVVVGDPNQSILSFRGADPSRLGLGTLDQRGSGARQAISQAARSPGTTNRIVLATNYRSSAVVRDAGSQLMANIWPSGLTEDERTLLVSPAVPPAPQAPAVPAVPAGEVSAAGTEGTAVPVSAGSAAVPAGEVSAAIPVSPPEGAVASDLVESKPDLVASIFDNEIAQSAHLAAALRAAKDSGLAWSDMAVLVRSPAREVSAVVRSLSDAAVPVQLVADPLPLGRQPAVSLLLGTAELVARLPNEGLTALEVEDLLISPIGRAAVDDVRSLRRWLERQPGLDSVESDSRLALALTDNAVMAEAPDRLSKVVRTAADLGQLLDGARRLIRADSTPAEIVWWLWSGGRARPASDSWPERLRRASLSNGSTSAAANRDLDAVMALLRVAERAPTRWGGHRGIEAFVSDIEGQEISAEPDLRAAASGEAVTIGSVFAAKGSEWGFVAILGLDEGHWPGPISRGSLIDPNQVTPDGLDDAQTSSALADDRRLLHFAMARSAGKLWLACCDADEPSRFLEACGIPVRRISGLPDRPQSRWELISELRQGCTSPDLRTRAAAGKGLRLLAESTDRQGRQLLPAADPTRWPDARDWTRAPGTLRRPEAPVSMSPSGLSSLSQCQVRWFLEREVRGSAGNGRAAIFGTVVHEAVAELINDARLGDPAAREETLDRLWVAVEHDAQWHAEVERHVASAALERAASWAASRPGTLRPEQRVDCTVDVVTRTGSADRVRIQGSIDVLETNDDGEAIVWDFKTRRSKTSKREVNEHMQLAAYRKAVENAGVAADSGKGQLVATEAGLVHLCVPAGVREPLMPADVRQGDMTSDLKTRADEALSEAASCVRGIEFTATVGTWCKSCKFARTCPARAKGVNRESSKD